MSSSLIGKNAVIRSNGFVDQDTNGFIAMIDEGSKSMLLKLDEPLKSTGTTYRHVVASARLSRDDLGVLDTVGVLGCSVTWVPEGKFDSNNPMDLSWWRGGAAAITDLCVN
ncbi:hypothetical protein FKG94_12520 [Exilibacterium tricleocarpae]|uniref:Uncharacterized protein n=1 Tax=Exilibacterium tricleocarpae TaxID=2591008 RepID=A0A545TNS0_9GAMM|nr:hypothetical protein [Exilibacterium tricleocarpae]TQV78838.1 hypothetical protein FKG94_12520 [Exilibacterium tricleocarpae]